MLKSLLGTVLCFAGLSLPAMANNVTVTELQIDQETSFFSSIINTLVDRVKNDTVGFSFSIDKKDLTKVKSSKGELIKHSSKTMSSSELQISFIDRNYGFALLQNNDIYVCYLEFGWVDTCYFRMRYHNERMTCGRDTYKIGQSAKVDLLVCRKSVGHGTGFYASGEFIFLLKSGFPYLGYLPTEEYSVTTEQEYYYNADNEIEIDKTLEEPNVPITIYRCPKVVATVLKESVEIAYCEKYGIDIENNALVHISGENTLGRTMGSVYRDRVESFLKK